MSGFVVEEGGMEKVIIVAISLILMDRNHVTYFLYERVFNNNNINICIAPYGRNFRGAVYLRVPGKWLLFILSDSVLLAKRLVEKSISKMAYFVSLNLNSVNHMYSSKHKAMV